MIKVLKSNRSAHNNNANKSNKKQQVWTQLHVNKSNKKQ